MEDSRRHAVIRSLVVSVVAVFAGIMAVVVTAARTIVIPPRSRDEDTGILSVDRQAGTITFSPSPDSIVNGRFSFWFSKEHGHARVGEILSNIPGAVTRELLQVDFGDLETARRGRFNGWFYLSPKDLGVEFEDVILETELGQAPAWRVPARADNGRWVIQIHGRAVVRTETIRAIPVFRDAGYTSLLISYRNDSEAPASADGRYALGDTEWHDVDAAVEYAVEHGAKSIVLMGWSMGGATALQQVTRSRLAGAINGVVLDSPVVDWVTALDYQARTKGIVRPLRAVVYALIGTPLGRPFTGQREPINLARLNMVKRAHDLRVPILLLHSDDDAYVPSQASRELAAARPDIVTLVTFTEARHTKLWNHEPELWNSSIAQWLARLNDLSVSSRASNEQKGGRRNPTKAG